MLVGLIALAACRDRAIDESDADRLLPLAPEEAATLAGRVGSSWIFDVTVSSSDVTDDIDASVDEDLEVVAGRIVAVDEVGAEPRVIADGFDAVTGPPASGLPWLAKRRGADTPGLWRIDPVNGAAPVRLTNAHGSFVWTRTGVLALDGDGDEEKMLVHLRETADGEVQKEGLREGVGSIVSNSRGAEVQDRIAFVTSAGDLIVRDVDDGAERVVRTGVSSALGFDAHARVMFVSALDGRYFAIDADDGRELALGPDEQGGYVGVVHSADQVVIGSGQSPSDEGRSIVVVMPDLRRLDLEGRWMVVFREPGEDGTVLLRGPDGLHRLDPGSTVPSLVLPIDTLNAHVIDDRISVLEDQVRDPLAPYTLTPRRLLVLDGRDAEPEVAFEGPFTNARLLAPDRWAFAEYADGRGGDVVLVDLDSGAEARLDGPVLGYFQTPDDFYAAVASEAEQTLLYYRDDDDRRINGIWLADVDRLLE
jgi:hypothetical protein